MRVYLYIKQIYQFSDDFLELIKLKNWIAINLQSQSYIIN